MMDATPPAPADFLERVLRLFETIHPLDRVPRAGFLLRGVTEPESVAAHSHFMALMALLFAEAYPGEYDKARLLAMAIVHDLPEARLMDIPMPYADAYMATAKQEAEQAVADDLFAELPGRLAALHADFGAAGSKEARLLRGLDKAQMMIKVLCYEREHRGHLEEFWGNPKNFADYGIAPVRDLFDAIRRRAGRA